MDCQVPGRNRIDAPQSDPLSYKLERKTPGQRKYAFIQANKFLQDVMMDPKAPGFLKDLIRSQNAIGMLGLELLLVAHAENELKGMAE